MDTVTKTTKAYRPKPYRPMTTNSNVSRSGFDRWHDGGRENTLSPTLDAPLQNRLLAALPADEMERLKSHLRFTSLPAGRVLFEAGQPIDRCYFLNSGIASLVLTSEEGAESSVGAVGREGMVGTIALLRESRPLHRAVMQINGSGWLLGTEVLHAEFKRGGLLQDMLIRHMHTLLSQSSQTALCRCAHTVDRQVCSWLLLTRYQTDSDKLDLTHECIACTLGVRRAGVTVAAHGLREAGLIDYSRGHITILDQKGLEARACECHAVIRSQLDGLYRSH